MGRCFRRTAVRSFLLAVLGAAPALLATEPSAAAAAQRQLIVDAAEYPWSAVGRLNVGRHHFCSAVMVSERHFLTTAACLYNRAEKRWWPASALHFLPGYQGGDAPFDGLAKSYRVADGYRPGEHATAQSAAADWAVVELAEPLGRKTGWLGLGDAGKAAVIGQAGYRAEHRYAESFDYGCRIIGPGQKAGSLLADDCQSAPGSIGGPILAFLPDGPRVAGIMVGSGTSGEHPFTAAVASSSLTDRSRFPEAAKVIAAAGIAQGGGQPPAAAGAIRREPGKTLGELGGTGNEPPSLPALTRALAKAVGQ